MLATNIITDPALVEDQVFRNFFVYTIQDTRGRSVAFREASDIASGLLEQIETQLEDSER